MMIPPFKLKERPPTDMDYTQVVHVDAFGRTIMEFIPRDPMKSKVTPMDRFIGIDTAEAEVMAQGQPATAQTQLRFKIPAKNINQAWELFDAEAQKALDAQMVEMRQHALARPGALPPGSAPG